MRRFVVATVLVAVLAATPGALGKPILGITGNHARFKAQTTQESIVHQAFLSWGQGQTFGAPFSVLLKSLGPVPMLHLGLAKKGAKPRLTTATIAAGQGDSYLAALNLGIAAWGQAIYIRPLAEMNNRGNPWCCTPASYRKAFARIFVLVHGGPGVNAKLAALGLPAYKGPTLATNAFPRVRVLWSPLAGGDDPKPYWPGDAYVDVGGADIYKEAGQDPPWSKFDELFSFSRAHGKPFAVPEWGLFGVDDPSFVQHMCDFLKSHVTEMEAFYESKPGSIFDLGDKPGSRAVYKRCIVPQAGALPAWGQGGPGSAKQIALKLEPDQDSGDPPLDVTFSITAQLSVPIVQWQVVFGDGATQSGQGPPPDTVTHTYADDGVYQAVLIVYQGPPFTGTAIRFLTTAKVTVGTGNAPLVFTPAPAGGKAPLAVSFHIQTHLPKAVRHWQLVFGDGLTNEGSGTPPHFAGHTFSKAGSYRVLLIVDEAPFSGTLVRLIATANVKVS
ncbi:MAG TPA: PKD domain-containing protein [Gaiellaceae bacterium]|nr:PKD domain-containing protein [Gaiellaceae bacterium]